ncbi:MAG: PepSY domain-containing protein [Gammaproteobacteria bacterium]|nr:PepSY domain-containing protein [Gammaproteobacteria bacterium]
MYFLLIVHRYLAVAVGLLMTLWCLSGFVMMYQAMPELSPQQRLDGLQPLTLTRCCNLGGYSPHDNTPLGDFSIEMLLGEPVVRFNTGQDNHIISLSTGETVPALNASQLLSVAELYGAGNNIAGTPSLRGIIEVDQWTLQSAKRHQPAWHIAFDDAAGTEIYINGRTGEVFQQTRRRERVLAWIGAIPHWLYPTMLRQNAALWSDIVIWTSVLGSFLAATGLYVGITRLRRHRDTGTLESPYQGWWYWHHISGLVFGVLVLTWVFSGLMTMNPWGVLSGSGANNYRPQLIGNAPWSELRQFLTAIENGNVQLPDLDPVVQITPTVFDQRLYPVLITRQGAQTRLDSNGHEISLSVSDIERVVATLDTPVSQAGLMIGEDSYYYGHKREVPLPVYRVVMDDAEQTRLYINTNTGAVRSVGSTERWSRWIRTGLHDLDFPVLRLRPIWDVVVILLLIGVTAVCVTGTWMSFRRIRRDMRSLRRHLRTSPAKNLSTR